MDKVFITGANGMLGSHVCRELIKRGYAIKAMCLPFLQVKTLDNLLIEIVYGSVLDKSFILENMRGCDYVIHIAAITDVWPRRSNLLKKVNIQGTINVMEVAITLNVKKMVHVGSASSFQYGSIKKPGNETNQYNGWKNGMDYLDSKYIAQKILLEQYAKSGFPVIIINPTFMIGAFDTGPTSGQLIVNYFKGKLLGYSCGGKNFVCAADVACAVVNALKKGEVGQCYIAGNLNLTYKEFLKRSANVMNKTFSLKKMPTIIILSVGYTCSLIARVTKKKPKISFGIAKFSTIEQYYTSEKSVRELDMPQTPIEIGIKDAMTWFNENSYL